MKSVTHHLPVVVIDWLGSYELGTIVGIIGILVIGTCCKSTSSMLLTARFFQSPARLLKVHLVHRNSALSTFTRPGDEGGREPSPCTPPRSFRQSTGAWLEEALAKTPKNDLSDQKTFSKYRHPTVRYLG